MRFNAPTVRDTLKPLILHRVQRLKTVEKGRGWGCGSGVGGGRRGVRGGGGGAAEAGGGVDLKDVVTSGFQDTPGVGLTEAGGGVGKIAGLAGLESTAAVGRGAEVRHQRRQRWS